MSKRPLTASEVLRDLFSQAKRVESGCLISHLIPNAKGYCYVSLGGRTGKRVRANRFILEQLLRHPLPEGMLARHTCDIRNCIEPEHIIPGSAKDNSQDMVARGRQGGAGRPPIDNMTLFETVELRRAGCTLERIAKHQGLAGPSSVADRLRRAQNEYL